MAAPQSSRTEADDTLRLEAVYFSAPIPRNLAVLTILGAVFDKVYFPGVYLPKTGFDVSELEKEIRRLRAVPQGGSHDRDLLIGSLTLTKYAKTLEGFCEFTADPDDVFGQKTEPPAELVRSIYDAIHGPPRPGFIPSFQTGFAKGIPGSEETMIYPGPHHYIARALLMSGERSIPLLNDVRGLPVPGLPDTAPIDDAKLLAATIAIECTRIARKHRYFRPKI